MGVYVGAGASWLLPGPVRDRMAGPEVRTAWLPQGKVGMDWKFVFHDSFERDGDWLIDEVFVCPDCIFQEDYRAVERCQLVWAGRAK